MSCNPMPQDLAVLSFYIRVCSDLNRIEAVLVPSIVAPSKNPRRRSQKWRQEPLESFTNRAAHKRILKLSGILVHHQSDT
jgi:hypothetical protein